jgi:predicted ribonuclease YlaK
MKVRNIKDKELLEEIDEHLIKQKRNNKKENRQPMDPIKHFVENYSVSNFKSNSQNQKKIIKSILDNDIAITVIHGKPGTGKTYSALQGALKEFKTNRIYDKIYLMKSVKTLDNKSEDLGFLKGSLEEKVAPFIFSYDFNFSQLINKSVYEFARENQIIEFLPLAYIRGIGIKNAIIILDECQNVNTNILRTVLTRVGENCKLIIMGDTQQKDSSNKNSSGLEFLIKHFKDKIKGMEFIEMNESDQTRNPMINEIEKIYDDLEKQGIQID